MLTHKSRQISTIAHITCLSTNRINQLDFRESQMDVVLKCDRENVVH